MYHQSSVGGQIPIQKVAIPIFIHMTTPAVPGHGKTEDLAILSSWVKKELFDTVKFIFEPEVDLVEKGPIYNLFVKDCKSRLVGLKLIEESNQALRWLYVKSLWNEATRRKKNLVADGLNAKRSTTYSAMKNGFIGKDCCSFRSLLFFVVFGYDTNTIHMCLRTLQPLCTEQCHLTKH